MKQFWEWWKLSFNKQVSPLINRQRKKKITRTTQMNKQQLDIAEAALRFISVGIFLSRNNYIKNYESETFLQKGTSSSFRNSDWKCCGNISPPSNSTNFLLMHKIPKFHLISWYRNFVERHCFRRVSTKLCLSTKFQHQENRWNFCIFCSAYCHFWVFLRVSKIFWK